MVLLITSCAISVPEPDICGIYSPDKAECVPTKSGEVPYEINRDDMLAYQCFSPEDFADMKTFIRQVLEEMDTRAKASAKSLQSVQQQ